MEEPLLRRAYWLKIKYNRAFVCQNDTTNCTYLNVSASVIIYAPYINSTVRLEDNTYITTSNTSISASIYEGRRNTVVFFVVGYLVFDTCIIDGAFRVLRHDLTYISGWKRCRISILSGIN
jgi:hypothetical protein